MKALSRIRIHQSRAMRRQGAWPGGGRRAVAGRPWLRGGQATGGASDRSAGVSVRMTRLAGAGCASLYAAFIVWVYVSQARTMAQMTGGVAWAVGAYNIDQAHFDEGLRSFRCGQFPAARSGFERADPAHAGCAHAVLRGVQLLPEGSAASTTTMTCSGEGSTR